MIVKFEKEYLVELYTTGKCSDKKYRFQPRVVLNYKRKIDVLIDSPSIETLFLINSLNYEVLKEDKKSISSIRIDKQYRLEFIVSNEMDTGLVITICKIINISNHYK